MESSRILPDALRSYRPSKVKWNIVGIFAYDLYEGFVCKQEVVDVVIDLVDVYNSINYEHFVRRKKEANKHKKSRLASIRQVVNALRLLRFTTYTYFRNVVDIFCVVLVQSALRSLFSNRR